MAQARAPRRGEPSTFCRAPEALTLFALTVQHVLRAQRLAGEWPVFQVPCESPAADAAPRPNDRRSDPRVCIVFTS